MSDFDNIIYFRFNRYHLLPAELDKLDDKLVSCLCGEACFEDRHGPNLFCE